MRALFPHTKRGKCTPSWMYKANTRTPCSLPEEKSLNTHSQKQKHESSQLNSPEAIVRLLLGNSPFFGGGPSSPFEL